MNNKIPLKDYLTFVSGVVIMIASLVGIICLTYFANCWLITNRKLPIIPRRAGIWNKNVNAVNAVIVTVISVSVVKLTGGA